MTDKALYEKWVMERNRLEEKIFLDPGNLDLANKVWHFYRTGLYNISDMGKAISIYRESALVSEEGLQCLAKAVKELFDEAGSLPEKRMFDVTLLEKINNTLKENGKVSEEIVWLSDVILGK